MPDEIKETVTSKQVSWGALAVAAAALAVASVDAVGTKEAIPASAGEQDVIAASVANVGSDMLAEKSCEKIWAVRTKAVGAELLWACGGAVLPAQDQAAMAKQLPGDAIRVIFRPREVDGQIVMDADVWTGEAPDKPLEVVPVPPPPVPVEEPVEP